MLEADRAARSTQKQQPKKRRLQYTLASLSAQSLGAAGASDGSGGTHDKQLLKIISDIEAIKSARNDAQNDMYRIAIAAREQACLKRMTEDFERGQRALLSSSALDQREGERGLNEALDSLHVFQVSAMAYQCLSGHRNAYPPPPGFDNLAQTGLLALREHSVRLTDKIRSEVYHSFISDALTTLNDLFMWAEKATSSGQGLRSFTQRQEALKRGQEQQALRKVSCPELRDRSGANIT